MVPAIGRPMNCSGSSLRAAADTPLRSCAGSRALALRGTLAAALAAAFAIECPAQDAATAARAGDTAGTTVTGEAAGPSESLETAALKRLNEARSQPRRCGPRSFAAAPPLKWSSALAAAAAAQALWMQSTDTLGHEADDGATAGDRAQAAGYRWEAIGENVAAGAPDVAEAVSGWLASPPHCENIMNPAFEEAAIAMVPGTGRNTYPTWWTLVLARPR